MYLVAVGNGDLAFPSQSVALLAERVTHDRLARRRWTIGGATVDCISHKEPHGAIQKSGSNSNSFELILGNRLEHGSPSPSGSWIEIKLNSKENQIHISRDAAGLMAAFFARIASGYIISDSIPALLAHADVTRKIDFDALNEYWHLDFCIAPKTIWEDIRSVPNGHRVLLSLESSCRPVYRQTWVPGQTARQAPPLLGKEATATIRNVILTETQQIISSTTQGFINLLSGGIDSSVVLAACHVLGRKPEHVITFKGVGKADETELAALTANSLRIPVVIAKADSVDLVEDAYRIASTWGQPYAHGSVHAMQQILQHVPKGHAVLTGDGGGEAFLGEPPSMSPWRWIADPIFRSLNVLPPQLRISIYRLLASRSFIARALAYGLELKAACSEKQWHLRTGPITQWEMEAAISLPMHEYFTKARIEEILEELGHKSDLAAESLFARSLCFWWGPEGVYSKTWRLLDAKGLIGYAPLSSARFFDTVKRIPIEQRGSRKQALRDAFSDVLPTEVLNAPKRGLRPVNRELLVKQADAGISWITNGASPAWDQLFDRNTIKRFWSAHRDGKVYRSNLLYKAIVFRAWCDTWKPEFKGI